MQKRPRDETSTSHSRKRKTTVRYGHRESSITYNDYIQNLDADESQCVGNDMVPSTELVVASIQNERTDSNQNEFIDLNMVYTLLQASIEKIESLKKHVSTLDDHIIKLDVRMKNSHGSGSSLSAGPSTKPRIIDLTQLKVFILPVETESELDKLEANLKKADEWRDKLVSSFVLYICSSTN